jgi:hypothetical protein
MVRSVVEPALKRAVDDVRVRDPESLQRDMSADYLAIAVAGRDQAKPALWTIDYLPERGNRIGVETKTYPLRGVVVAPDHLGLSIIGERGAIDRDYPDTRLIPALRAEPAKTARTLSS